MVFLAERRQPLRENDEVLKGRWPRGLRRAARQ